MEKEVPRSEVEALIALHKQYRSLAARVLELRREHDSVAKLAQDARRTLVSVEKAFRERWGIDAGADIEATIVEGHKAVLKVGERDGGLQPEQPESVG